MGARDKRIGRVRRVLDASPIRREVMNEAYGWFTDCGELPVDDHIAYEVVQQAMRGGEVEPIEDDAKVADRVRRARLAYHQRERPGNTWPPSVRACLFDEALFEVAPLRKLARWQIACEVDWGGDVENEAFAARHGIAVYGSIAMHIAGWPGKLAVPPYEAAARTLFVRLDNIRGRILYQGPGWFDAQGKAILAFRERGELPNDDLHLESVIVNFGLDLLADHKRGKDVAKAMKLVGESAWKEGAELDVVLQKLGNAAMARRP